MSKGVLFLYVDAKAIECNEAYEAFSAAWQPDRWRGQPRLRFVISSTSTRAISPPSPELPARCG